VRVKRLEPRELPQLLVDDPIRSALLTRCIREVQQQPQVERRVRERDMHTAVPGLAHRLRDIPMPVTVKQRPELNPIIAGEYLVPLFQRPRDDPARGHPVPFVERVDEELMVGSELAIEVGEIVGLGRLAFDRDIENAVPAPPVRRAALDRPLRLGIAAAAPAHPASASAWATSLANSPLVTLGTPP
jgi:hypothetical protein